MEVGWCSNYIWHVELINISSSSISDLHLYTSIVGLYDNYAKYTFAIEMQSKFTIFFFFKQKEPYFLCLWYSDQVEELRR